MQWRGRVCVWLLAVLIAGVVSQDPGYTAWHGYYESIAYDFTASNNVDGLTWNCLLEPEHECGFKTALVFDRHCTARSLGFSEQSIDYRQIKSFLVDDLRFPSMPTGYIHHDWSACYTQNQDAYYRLQLQISHQNHDAPKQFTNEYDSFVPKISGQDYVWKIGEDPQENAWAFWANTPTYMQGDQFWRTIDRIDVRLYQQSSSEYAVPQVAKISLGAHYYTDYASAGASSYEALLKLAEPGMTPYWHNSWFYGDDRHVTASHNYPNVSFEKHYTQTGDCADVDAFAGPFATWSNPQELRLEFDDLPTHSSLQMTADILFRDSWNGEEDNDRFVILVDGHIAFESTVSLEPSKPMCFPLAAGCDVQDAVPGTTGLEYMGDHSTSCSDHESWMLWWVAHRVTVIVPHTARTAVFQVTFASDLEGSFGGDLGVDNVLIATDLRGNTPSTQALPLWAVVTIVLGVVSVAGAAAVAVVLRNRSSNELLLPSKASGSAAKPAQASKPSSSKVAAAQGTGTTSVAIGRARSATAPTASASRSRSGSRPLGNRQRNNSSRATAAAAAATASTAKGRKRGISSPPPRTGASKSKSAAGKKKNVGFDAAGKSEVNRRASIETTMTMMTSGSAISAYGTGDDYGTGNQPVARLAAMESNAAAAAAASTKSNV